MMNKTLIHNVKIVNEGKVFDGYLCFSGNYITDVGEGEAGDELKKSCSTLINGEGKLLIPGLIDDQVHFREPGLTHKGELYTEAKAAVAGGITSYMEMPNTKPSAVTIELLEEKYQRAAEVSLANYSFYMGTTNSNLNEILKENARKVCGVKIFLGSSTGDMLVNDEKTLDGIFKECKQIITLHCEDDPMIKANMQHALTQYNGNIPFNAHPQIRSEEACYRSSSKAVERAEKFGTRIHVLHISTARELSLFRSDIPLNEKKITAEACIHHLWFTDSDYASKGPWIKWNPAVKTEKDRDEIREAVKTGKIDVIATDHAPHTREEKMNEYANCPSGGPLVQHSLNAMLDMYHQGIFTLEEIVSKMCHAPADLFRIEKRGYLKPGYFADMVLVDLNKSYQVSKENILYKCAWSPFEGHTFTNSVTKTWVNGHLAYDKGLFNESQKGERLLFNA
jgi:dihydroorotase